MRHLQLEAQIAASPDDEGLRQVYADWLLDREDPRGELITVQGELARLPAGHERRRALEQRERALLAAHGTRWLAEMGFPDTAQIRTRGSAVIFRRGFVDEVRLTLPQLLEARPALLGVPLRRLVVLSVTDEQLDAIEALAALEPFPHLTGFGLRGLNVGAEAWALLAGAPLLGAVEELELANVMFRGDFERLAQRLVPLKKLAVREYSRTNGLEGLASALGALEVLDLEGTDTRPLWSLFRSDKLSSLEDLRLRSCWADDAVVGAVASARMPLVHLDLGGWNMFGEEGVRSLVKTRRLGRLKILRIRRTGRTAEQLLALQKRFQSRLVVEDV